jgi:gluconokinase
LIVVVMGVSGSGKSTLAAQLVERTGWAFAEGDDYHPQANKAKMAAGIALTDQDRLPWLDALHDVLAGWAVEGRSGILTCSALKQSYRVDRAAPRPPHRPLYESQPAGQPTGDPGTAPGSQRAPPGRR